MKTFKLAKYPLLILVGMIVASLASATSPGRRTDTVTGSVVAPTLEDHADYFTEAETHASEETQRKADKLRLKTIASIKALLKSKAKKKTVRRFELLIRLGELHVERHDYMRDREMKVYDSAYQKWQSAATDKRGKEPQPNTKASKAELIKGVNAFRTLVNEFPKHPRTDAALFALAKTLARLGKSTAPNYYQRLIRKYPKSKLIPDAYLALGEYYFENQKVPEALANYKKAMKYKNHPAYAYAVYKLGWAYYNMPQVSDAEAKTNLKKAVTAFKLVVKLSDKDRKKRRLDLRKEAIRDLVMVWAEAEDVDSAWRYFKTVGNKDAFYQMLERLGHIYYEQGKSVKAIVVYERIIREAPYRSRNPEHHARLLELYDGQRQQSKVVRTLVSLPGIYLSGSRWAGNHNKNKDALEKAERTVRHNMHRYGTLYHNRGLKAKDKAYMHSASKIYEAFLATFPKDKEAYNIRFYLAEILFDFKKYDQSSKHYMIVAKSNPTGKHHKTAALNAVAAVNQWVEESKFAKLPPAGQVVRPITIPKEKQALISTIDQYVQILPREKAANPMRFTAAEIYFDYGHYDAAMRRFEDIVATQPRSKQADASVRMVINYYTGKKNWTAVVAKARRFEANPKLENPKLRLFIVESKRKAIFKEALAFEKAKDYRRAAKSFTAYYSEFPRDKNADRALYNAMLNHYRVGEIENAVAAGKLILDRYPKSETKPNVIASLASTHEATVDFEAAAHYYKLLATSFPKDKRSPQALFNAALLYKGLNEYKQAAALLRSFLTTHGKNEISTDASWELADVLERQKAYPSAIKAYEKFARTRGTQEQKLHAQAKAAELTILHGDSSLGKRRLRSLGLELTKNDKITAFEARRIVAGAMFRQLESEFQDFKAIRVHDGRKVESIVKRKQDRLVKLAESYENVIAIGNGEFAVASLYRLGEAHENFANVLFKAPGPVGGSQAELNSYKTELEKVAFPLKEQSNKFFETAFKRSKEVQTFTDWTKRSYDKMVEISPERYREVNTIAAAPRYITHTVKAENNVASLLTE